MTARDRVGRVARVLWGALRARVPGAQPALETAREGLRSPGGRARQAADLARRVHELERDQALLAAQVAAMQVPATDGGDADLVGRLTAARLEAIASYEHRIGELERRAKRRDTPGRRALAETIGELPGRAT